VRNVQSMRTFPDIRVVMIVQHGAERDGNATLCAMYHGVMTWFGTAFARNRSVILAPQIQYSEEALDGGYSWENSTRLWAWGFGSSIAGGSASRSLFEVYDQMLLALANTTRFPNLKRVLLVGHSAGGQAMQRYAVPVKCITKFGLAA